MAKADLLFELGTEELPPLALQKLSRALETEFTAGLKKAGLEHGAVHAYATPRRLALWIEALDQAQPDRDRERRGPAVRAAFDADGRPTQAAEGFARSCGVTVDQLGRIRTDKGEWLTYTLRERGKPAAEWLPGIAETALNRLPIPKRMRWGASEAQFVRPVHWLLFLHGDAIVPCTLLDAVAGRTTRGHRFHHPEEITIQTPDEYAAILEFKGKVLADFAQRRERIRAQVATAAAELNGRADPDETLLDEVTALNEWPAPITGSFDAAFLEVPQEALVLTMKKNQKYFPIFGAQDGLMNHFITIANLESKDPAVIRAGNERVIRPRLADARFFWRKDGEKTLAERQASLAQVVFQKDLGTLLDKTHRVANLAAYIARGIGADEDKVRRAAMLSRCDLMTETVYEFPEMQGIMGRYQAGRDGEDPELAQALDEFYWPRFSGGRLPETPTGTCIALAERLDTLTGIFGIGQRPTGDKDPFGLRRAALGALRILKEGGLTLDLADLIRTAIRGFGERVASNDCAADVLAFMLERLKGLYAEEGIGADLFEAVAEVRLTSLADFNARIQAVSRFRQRPEAESLAAANKRIRNILKKSQDVIPDQVDIQRFESDAEQALHAQIETLRDRVQSWLDTGEYDTALQALAALRENVDAFFDQVMVMANDPAVRANRLALLNNLYRMFLGVADIGRLQTH